jgi:Flp pilus assembly protein TadD
MSEIAAAYIALGRGYFDNGQFQAALATLRFASARCGAHPELDRWLGAAAQKCDDDDLAMHAYTRALEATPNDVQVVVNLAELYLSSLRLDAARGLLERAVALDPDLRHPAGIRARMLIMKTRQSE